MPRYSGKTYYRDTIGISYIREQVYQSLSLHTHTHNRNQQQQSGSRASPSTPHSWLVCHPSSWTGGGSAPGRLGALRSRTLTFVSPPAFLKDLAVLGAWRSSLRILVTLSACEPTMAVFSTCIALHLSYSAR